MIKKYYAKKNSQKNRIEIKIQHWGGNIQVSMEGIAVEYFPNSIDTGRNKISEFHSYISYDNEKDACDSHAGMFHLFKNI